MRLGVGRWQKVDYAFVCVLAIAVGWLANSFWPGILAASDSYASMSTFRTHDAQTVGYVYQLIVLKVPFSEFRSGYYPHFMTMATMVISSPYYLYLYLVQGAITFKNVALSSYFTQFVFLFIGGLYSYRLVRFRANSFLALLGALSFITMYELVKHTIMLGPDVYITVLIVAFSYHLVVYNENGSSKQLYAAIILASCAVSAKYYGVFCFPAIFFTYCAKNAESHRMISWRSVLFIVKCIVILLAVYVACNPWLLFSFYKMAGSIVVAIFNTHTSVSSVIDGSPAVDLLPYKLRLVVSQSIVGPIVAVLWLVTTVYCVARDWRRKEFSSYIVLFLILLPFLLYYGVMHNDDANIPNGSRYYMPFVSLFLPFLLWNINELLTQDFPWKACGIALAVVVVASQVDRITGKHNWVLPLDFSRSYIRSHYLTNAINAEKNGGMRTLLRQSYRPVMVGKYEYSILRKDLSDEERKSISSWYNRKFQKISGASFLNMIAKWNSRGEAGGYLVRDWVKQNVPAGSVVLTESYINLQNKSPIRADLNINSDLQSLVIVPKYRLENALIESYSPTYALTKYYPLAQKVLDSYDYSLVATVGKTPYWPKVYVLKKNNKSQ